ncbi:unnamed protein product [Cylicocyclus nassatus]|uniref:Uncharacterized protein n=1 Tax=Cylicocyclus nassatus TaxID=53992 RepID=A0AA36GPA0_CYLNA|nr:unnamed protein product [Cylicocyclus nassatus]
MNMSSASVPRAHRHHHHHRQQQQHNVALFGSPGPATFSASAPATPKGRQEVARRQARRPISFNAKIGANQCYAGSKFSDSPTARAIPLPPTEWIYEAFSSQSDSSSMSSAMSERCQLCLRHHKNPHYVHHLECVYIHSVSSRLSLHHKAIKGRRPSLILHQKT